MHEGSKRACQTYVRKPVMFSREIFRHKLCAQEQKREAQVMRISPREKESCKIVCAADFRSDDDFGSVRKPERATDSIEKGFVQLEAAVLQAQPVEQRR